MSDYRVKITIRNDRILSKIEELGFQSVMQFCRHTGMVYTYINNIINGKIPPLKEKGELRDVVKILLENLDMEVEDAFTERQLQGFAKNSFETKVKEKQLLQMINPVKNHESRMIEKDVKKSLNDILHEYLNPREINILLRRYGFTGEGKVPYSEIGLPFNITTERVRQIELRAINKLKQPFIRERLIATGFYDIFSTVDVKQDEIKKQEYFNEELH